MRGRGGGRATDFQPKSTSWPGSLRSEILVEQFDFFKNLLLDGSLDSIVATVFVVIFQIC